MSVISAVRIGNMGEPWGFEGLGNTINPLYLTSVARGHREVEGSASAVPSSATATTAGCDLWGRLLTYHGHLKHNFKCPLKAEPQHMKKISQKKAKEKDLLFEFCKFKKLPRVINVCKD